MKCCKYKCDEKVYHKQSQYCKSHYLESKTEIEWVQSIKKRNGSIEIRKRK